MPRQDEDSANLTKILLTVGLVALVVFTSSIMFSAYPQNLWINKETVVDATVGFIDNNIVNIRGNQVTYNTGDTIPLSNREYIRITGNQKQIGDKTFTSGIRTVTAGLQQNALFEELIGDFTPTQTATLNNGRTTIILSMISPEVVNVKTPDSNYNIEFVQDTTYVSSGNLLIKLKKQNTISIYVVGTESHTIRMTKI